MLGSLDIGRHTTNTCTLARFQYQKEVLAAVLNEDNGELMEYCHLIGNPKYRALWSTSYRDKLGRLTQGMPGRVKDTDNIYSLKSQIYLQIN